MQSIKKNSMWEVLSSICPENNRDTDSLIRRLSSCGLFLNKREREREREREGERERESEGERESRAENIL